jgi:two-component system, NarL family, sensor histidine kinase DevS
MADRALALLDGGTVVILLEDRGELRIGACRGEQTASLRIAPVNGSALGALYSGGEAVALDGPRGEDAAWLHELGLQARSALAEPLQMEGLGGGLVVAVRSDSRFGRHDPESLHAFARSLAERLTAERSVEIERVRHGIQARERERTRWAREIHDEAIQGMGALRMKLANARELEDPDALKDTVEVVLEGLGHEIDGLRHLITELRPAALDDLGLEAALQALARRAQAVDGLDVKIEVDPALQAAQEPSGERSSRLDAELEGTIYRVVQEALTNVGRHAEASKAVVRVEQRDGELHASVTDDGRGLPGIERMGPRGDGLEGGFGMSGMRERAELVGGDLEFGPAVGGGTTVRLVVPLSSRPRADAEPVGQGVSH